MLWRTLLFVALLALSSVPAGAEDWPQFRGPNRDNKITGFTAPATWPKELKKKWQVTVGEGLASPALVGDKLYVFTRVDENEVLTCLDANTGKEIWKEKYKCEAVKGVAGGFPGGPSFKGTRSSPAVGDGKVCTFSVAGRVTCFDAATGKVAWFKETEGKPMFYTSTSPLIADGKCIVHSGTSGSFGKGGAKGMPGKGELVAYDLGTGAEKWKWSGDGPGYGSPILATIHGVKQVVEQTDENLIGIGLADGKLLWKIACKVTRYQSWTPIVDGSVVFCADSAFTIEKSGATFEAKRLWKERVPAQYNTPVLKDNVLYGLADAGGGFKGGGKGGQKSTTLFAQDAKTGAELWKEKTSRGECGAILDAGSVLLLLSSDSNFVAFKPDKDDYKEVAKYTLSDNQTWAMPIIAGKRIYVKDLDSVILWTLE